jgi:hypothetical protein
MIKNFRILNPNLFSITLATFMAAFAYLFMVTGLGVFTITEVSQSILMRTAYVAATCLLMFDVLETVYIARGSAQKKFSLYFWMYAFYMGYFWMLLMVLMHWDGMQSASRVLFSWGCAGAVFGLAMSWMTVPNHTALEHRYELDKPATGHFLGLIYYVWPILVVALILGFLLFPPAEGWGEKYFLFQLIFLGTTMPLYGFKNNKFWKDFFPRALGIAFLLYGLLWS